MATDGVKIIDGDHAHDVYHTFMDLYDTGTSFEQIQAAVEPLNVGDDFDTEIFITAYALALWETGQLTEEIRQQVQQVIQRGAFVEYLTQEEAMPAEGRRRQKVLDRFWQKITLPNPKIRKRKNHKPQLNFLFEEGDVLTFQMPDGSYRATILLLISQHRGRCNYDFAIPTYTESAKPTLDDIITGEIVGGIYEPPNFPEYKLGFNVVGVNHKDLRKFADRFELIGHLEIALTAQCCGTQGGAISFESFTSNFRDFNSFFDVKMTTKTHPRSVFPVSKLL